MSLSLQPSIRAQIIERRTYLRPLNDAGTLFETPEQALQRQMAHQRWLWTRAQGRPLSPDQEDELTELADLIRQRKVTLSGRTRWLGGTETASRRESSQFNCSFKNFKTVHDGVDLLWLLLQGCGVGARPVIGILNGFSRPIDEVEVIRSELTMEDWEAGHRASPDNEETFHDGVWTIKIGDSAEAWAKALGKLLAGKFPARKLVLDLRRIRPAGVRLKGYGWISSGDAKIAIAFPAIAKILSQQAGKLLTRINLLDIFNWMAEILTSRRAAELGLLEWQSPEWEEFALAKRDYWATGNNHRRLSNNTILFNSKPTRRQLKSFIDMMIAGGGSDPGLANGVEALRRASYFSGFNPCVTSDTWILTREGPRQVSQLLDAPFDAIVHGRPYQATAFWSTGTKQTVKITTDRGYEIRLTPDHKLLVEKGRAAKRETVDGSRRLAGWDVATEWVEAGKLQVGDKLVLGDNDGFSWGRTGIEEFDMGWLVGEVLGDGGHGEPGSYHSYARFWGPNAKEMADRAYGIVESLPLNYVQPSLSKAPVNNSINKTWQVMSKRLTDLCGRFLVPGSKSILPELERQSSDFVAGFLRGWFDADGSVQGTIEKGCSVRLTSADHANLIIAQRMLARLGIGSTIYSGRHAAGQRQMPDGKGGLALYECRETHELVVARSSITRFHFRIGFYDPDKEEKLSAFADHQSHKPVYKDRMTAEVVSVKEAGEAEVFDCTVDEVHCFDANGIIAHNCAEILLGDGSFCVHGDTKLITRSGVTRIEDAVGKPIEIWNGKRWAEVIPFQTSKASKLLRVRFSDGSFLDVTENHRFFVRDRFGAEYEEVLAKNLSAHSKYQLHTEPFTISHDRGEDLEHAYTIGFYVGDGSGKKLDVYGEAKAALPLAGDLRQESEKEWVITGLPFDWRAAMLLKGDLTPAFSWSRASIIDFVSGLADADGSNTAHGAIRIYQGNETFCRDLQLLLTKAGIRSSVNFMTDKPSNFGERLKPMWYVQITDVRELRTHRLKHDYAGGKSGKGKWQNITSVEPLPGLHPTFCFSEPETTKGVFGNSLTGQCNLVETVLPYFNGDEEGLHRAHYLVARACYRQTCVNLHDGILQASWHELNEFLRLTGSGVTGVVDWEFVNEPEAWRDLRKVARRGVDSMAFELGLPLSQLNSTVKPSGTQSKANSLAGFEIKEGMHNALGRYLFNNVDFSQHDPLVPKLEAAGFCIRPNPYDAQNVLVRLPVEYGPAGFTKTSMQIGGRQREVEVNLESATTQLDRYRMVMDNYVDHNASITVSYDKEEAGEIVDWLADNWSHYVGVSFLFRNDPTKTAEDLGHRYLPQEVVDAETYHAYADTLRGIDLLSDTGEQMIDVEDGCPGGICPVR